jgi:inner membrane protein
MPTILTHPVVALALSAWRRAPLGAPLVAAGVMLTVLPDADTIPRHLGIALGGAWGHRGASHSLVFAALVAATAAVLGKRAWPSVPMRTAFAFLFACAASHGVLDMLTDGGPGIAWAWPFSDARAFLPWRPIAVSPLDADRFFGPRGRAVLASEGRWLWLPGLALFALGRGWRRRAAEPAP